MQSFVGCAQKRRKKKKDHDIWNHFYNLAVEHFLQLQFVQTFHNRKHWTREITLK